MAASVTCTKSKIEFRNKNELSIKHIRPKYLVQFNYYPAMDSIGALIEKTSICENYFKRRKLTCDSGYGDDEERMNDISSSFDEIVSNEFDDHLHDIIKHYENVVIHERKPYHSVVEASTEDKSIRKRRVTPIPQQMEPFKSTTGILS